MVRQDDWVALAVVARPHGVRGEVRVHPYNADSDLLYRVEKFFLRKPRPTQGPPVKEPHELPIEDIRPTQDAILIKFHGVDDRNAADALRGTEVCLRRRDFPPAEDGEFYACDVIGATVLLGEREIGAVSSLSSYPTVDVLLVEGPEGRWEVPLTDGYIEEVRVEAGRVLLRTLDALEPETP